MKIKCKDIKRENQKTCILCGKLSSNDGIIVMNNYICEDCIREITTINAQDSRYKAIKDKIKYVIVENKF